MKKVEHQMKLFIYNVVCWLYDRRHGIVAWTIMGAILGAILIAGILGYCWRIEQIYG